MYILRNFEKIVMSAYRWLADNYRDGDRIFLFGKMDIPGVTLPLTSRANRFLSWCIPSSYYRRNDRQSMQSPWFNSFVFSLDDVPQVGLIYKGNEEQIPLCVLLVCSTCLYISMSDSAYELYADHTSGGTTSTSSNFVFKSTRGDSETFTKLNTEQKEEEPGSLSERFKKTFSRNDVRVHFTGVWCVIHVTGVCEMSTSY